VQRLITSNSYKYTVERRTITTANTLNVQQLPRRLK